MVYNLFLFIHIVAVIVWIGGAFALTILNLRLARELDTAAAGALTRQSALFGRSVLGPAAMITLAAGIVMVVVSDMGVPFWVVWGIIGLIVSSLIGAIPMRKTGEALNAILSESPGDDAQAALRQRLTLLSALDLLVLLSVAWAMVFKPIWI